MKFSRMVLIAILLTLVFAVSIRAGDATVFSATALADDEGTPAVSVNSGEPAQPAEKKHVVKPGYGGWGGPFVMTMFPNIKAFDNITDLLGIDAFPSSMFMIGGMGTGQLGPHFRIGGGGAGGNLYTSGEVNGMSRKASLSIGYGGLVLYGLYPVNDKIELYARTLLGGGGLNLSITAEEFDEDIETTEGFFVWQPAIGVIYHPINWMSLELEGGYFGMVLPDVVSDIQGNEDTLIDGGFNGGPTVQLNILFGAVTKKK